MKSFDFRKYPLFEPIEFLEREWPNKRITHAPKWCSVDLRDGNQALIEPMGVKEKLILFNMLIEIGFKEIEVGFPAASKTDYEFIRYIINHNLIPEDVTIQVLTQAKTEIIKSTFESVIGARRVTVHVYNPVSPIQRENVFCKNKYEIMKIAENAAEDILEQSIKYTETEWVFQYSPESFTSTEIDFSIEVCDAVSTIWKPTSEKPMQVALPATVEVSTPNCYADLIEYFCKHIKNRASIIVSTHTHNDRGGAVAAAELALMAGAQRVEGTLLGNGERTGNMDLITMAMNMYSQGIDPLLDFSNMEKIIRVVSKCIQMEVNPRHPYCGDLVFTAFSGGHQDAISKCLEKYNKGDTWNIAYLPIDPRDIGRSYQNIIRINSQSGKGGIAYVIKSKLGIELPYWLQIEFYQYIQNLSEITGGEIDYDTIWSTFKKAYLMPVKTLDSFNLTVTEKSYVGKKYNLSISIKGVKQVISDENIVNALYQFLCELNVIKFEIIESNSMLTNCFSNNEYLSYVKIEYGNKQYFGISLGKGKVKQQLNALLKSFECIYNINEINILEEKLNDKSFGLVVEAMESEG